MVRVWTTASALAGSLRKPGWHTGTIAVPTRVYHITAIENLPLILGCGGLRCVSDLRNDGTDYANIAHGHLQDRRATTRVPCGPGGLLHDYVPFYFAPRSPMLYAIHKGNVAGCSHTQNDIAYLITSAEAVHDSAIGFALTDGHGITETTQFFDDLQGLGSVDWDIMRAVIWRDTLQDGDRKRRRQAEFLVHRFAPWSLIEEVAVMRQSNVARVLEILDDGDHETPVKAMPSWYF
jgi:hypothetical protein